MARTTKGTQQKRRSKGDGSLFPIGNCETRGARS